MSFSTTAVIPFHADRNLQRTLWLTLALFLSYLCVGMSLPVTPVYVTRELGFGNAWAGLAVGISFASTIATRVWAGRMADHKGSKHCLVGGLCTYASAALLCAAASWPGLSARAAYGVLIAGRLVLGVGESLTVVGLLAWCFGVMGPKRSGRVFALVGLAMYGAFAAGSPLGLALYELTGIKGVMGACALAPLLGLAMTLPLAAVATQPGERPLFWHIIGRIWQPGLALCLAGVGSAAIGAFVSLLFLSRGWPNAGLGLTCFGGAFVCVRILLGHVPDRVGSVPTALVSTALEASGQYLLWTAPTPITAFAGAFLTGLGCSLMFPAMGMDVVRRVAPHLRGTAAGGLAAFQDVAFGATGPLTGLLADRFGYGSVFLVGGLSASLSFAMVVFSAQKQKTAQPALHEPKDF